MGSDLLLDILTVSYLPLLCSIETHSLTEWERERGHRSSPSCFPSCRYVFFFVSNCLAVRTLVFSLTKIASWEASTIATILLCHGRFILLLWLFLSAWTLAPGPRQCVANHKGRTNDTAERTWVTTTTTARRRQRRLEPTFARGNAVWRKWQCRRDIRSTFAFTGRPTAANFLLTSFNESRNLSTDDQTNFVMGNEWQNI